MKSKTWALNKKECFFLQSEKTLVKNFRHAEPHSRKKWLEQTLQRIASLDEKTKKLDEEICENKVKADNIYFLDYFFMLNIGYLRNNKCLEDNA